MVQRFKPRRFENVRFFLIWPDSAAKPVLEQRWSGLSLRGVGLQGQCSLRRSTLERIGSHISDLNLGLRLTGGLTFGPNPGGLIRVIVVLF